MKSGISKWYAATLQPSTVQGIVHQSDRRKVAVGKVDDPVELWDQFRKKQLASWKARM